MARRGAGDHNRREDAARGVTPFLGVLRSGEMKKPSKRSDGSKRQRPKMISGAVYGARFPIEALHASAPVPPDIGWPNATMSPSLGGSVGDPERCTFANWTIPSNPTTRVSLGESGAPYSPRRPSTIEVIVSSALPSPATSWRCVWSQPTNEVSEAPPPSAKVRTYLTPRREKD